MTQPQQASSEQFNIIRFLGGSAPYVQHPGLGLSSDFPDQCEFKQVELISRHGECYPTANKVKDFKSTLKKSKDHQGYFKGVLSILNDCKYFVKDARNSQGAYAGTSNAMRHGAAFRIRSNSLYNPNALLPRQYL